MKRKNLSMKFLAMFISLSFVFTCVPISASAASEVAIDEMTTFVFNGSSVTVRENGDSNYEIIALDNQAAETEPEVTVNENGDSVYSPTDASTQIIQVSIKKKGGEYAFEGSGTGAIKVAKSGTADAVIYLNGLNLFSDFTSTIVANKNHETSVTVYAVEGTKNYLSDSEYNNDDAYAENLAAEKAVIKAKDGTALVLAGKGEINIDANGKNGIKAASALTVSDVSLNIDVLDNGISGEESITINSGNITIKSTEGDGIKCTAEEEEIGDITIEDGVLDIDVPCDGIQAMQNLTINGGKIKITTYNGYDDPNYSTDDASFSSAKGLKAGGSYIVTASDGSTSEVDATECNLTVNGGTINLNCADDAIHSDKDLTITAGKLTISSGDDAIHSEYNNTLGVENANNSDLIIRVNNCYEGVEGATINIYSGDIKLFSTDDAINAANADLTNYTFSMTIHGGNIYASAYNGDCFDANGNIIINGGVIVAIAGIAATDNESLDYDRSLTVNGGSVLSVQRGNGMANTSFGSTVAATWSAAGETTASTSSSGGSSSGWGGNRPGSGGSSSSSGFVANGNVLTVTDASGNVLAKARIKWNQTTTLKAAKVMYTGDAVVSGSKYTLTVEDIPEEEYTLSAKENSGCVVDSTEGYIYGLAENISSLDDYISYEEGYVEYIPTENGFGTGTVVNYIVDGEVSQSFVVIIFGDVNGDGVCDAQDAFIISLAVLKIIELDDSLMFAADCDRDGVVTQQDALFLESVGALLDEISQSGFSIETVDATSENANLTSSAQSIMASSAELDMTEQDSDGDATVIEVIIFVLKRIYELVISWFTAI